MKRLPLALATALLFCLPAVQAIPISDWRAEDLLMQAPDIRKELALNENQRLLWEQSERKTRTILRTRKERRDALDAAARTLAGNPAGELRTLAAPLDADAAATQAEDLALRETWLLMNDALDDAQRAKLMAHVRSMLERQPGGPGGEGKPERGNRPEGGGRGRGGPGGAGGMPGGGSPSGSGGISIGGSRGGF
ncbi:MAG: hypothetical protein AB1437_15485 [Pseudomonadota bacterium]